jgi:D-alanyl-lipoteichoic acid acyltransferase DltB (MBOAT superfamily)
MLFNSYYYFVFLLVVFIIYYNVNNKIKWIVLFAASLFFIGSFAPNLIVFTLLFTILNYFLGLSLQKVEQPSCKKAIFWFAIVIDIGILVFYKYINFFLDNLNFLLHLASKELVIPKLSIIIPIGISYYTFQALGYIIRINRGAEKAEKNFVIFATYLMFFPKFLSGPVERSNHFLQQSQLKIEFNGANVSSGLRLFLWGMFKKTVIGNNLAGPVTMVYNDVHNYTGVPLLVVMFIQTLHLYCDFSGYTDMALGSAKIFGINLVDNFNRPFFAKNVGEFWRRWHISLSSWCNDFIFSPFIVKFRKLGNTAAVIGIILTFFVIGIWHGANWTFVALGVLQGVAIVYEFYTKRKRLQIAAKLPQKFVAFSSRLITFSFFCLTLVFFNSHTISDSWYFLTHIFTNLKIQFDGYDFIYHKYEFIMAFLMFLTLFVIEIYQEKGKDVLGYFLSRPRYLRWSGYYILILLIFYFSGGDETFVYLQF